MKWRVRLQVEKIPETFASMEKYLTHFTYPLLEEIWADMYSCMEAISKAPFVEIISIKRIELEPHAKFCYQIEVGSSEASSSSKGCNKAYKPWVTDLFDFTDSRPGNVSDLSRYESPYILGMIRKDDLYEELPPNNYHFEASACGCSIP